MVNDERANQIHRFQQWDKGPVYIFSDHRNQEARFNVVYKLFNGQCPVNRTPTTKVQMHENKTKTMWEQRRKNNEKNNPTVEGFMRTNSKHFEVFDADVKHFPKSLIYIPTRTQVIREKSGNSWLNLCKCLIVISNTSRL